MREDALILFADLQAGIADLPLTVPYADLRRKVAALVKLGKLFGLPAVLSGVPTMEGPPHVLDEITTGFPELPVLQRSVADSFAAPNVNAAIVATKRRTVLIAGVATEVAVQLPSLSLARAGYDVHVVVDACAGISARTEDAAMRRMVQAGVKTTCVPTLIGELVGDFGSAEGQQAIGILFELAGG